MRIITVTLDLEVTDVELATYGAKGLDPMEVNEDIMARLGDRLVPFLGGCDLEMVSAEWRPGPVGWPKRADGPNCVLRISGMRALPEPPLGVEGKPVPGLEMVDGC
jgi:hypothetical protein